MRPLTTLALVLLAVMCQDAHSAQVTITIGGTVDRLTDVAGIFGPPNSQLTNPSKGKPFSLVMTVDDTKGWQHLESCGNSRYSVIEGKNAIAVLTIEGKSYTFDPNLGDGVASIKKYAPPCGQSLQGELMIEMRPFARTFLTASAIPAQGTTLTTDYHWQASFSNSNLLVANADTGAGQFYIADKKNVTLAYGFLQLTSVTVSGTSTEPDDCKLCAEIAKQYDSPTDKQESITLCKTLMGALKELGDYRASFLKSPTFINLFPTVYYNTTKIEMQRLAAKTFQYPIEKMQQMICFYDAYKSNRSRWEAGQSAEDHWQKHFESAVLADRRLQAYATINLTSLETAAELQEVLSLAVNAHVKYDLPRALLSSFQHRFHTSLTITEIQPDFFKTDATLRASSALGKDDIYAAAKNSHVWGELLLEPWLVEPLDSFLIGATDSAIDIRHEAWHVAFYGVLPTGKEPQPTTDHSGLLREGPVWCRQLQGK